MIAERSPTSKRIALAIWSPESRERAILLIAAKREDQISRELARHDYETNIEADLIVKVVQTLTREIHARTVRIGANAQRSYAVAMSGLHEPPLKAPLVPSARRPTPENPLLDAFNQAMSNGTDIEETRNALIARYGFAVPTDSALESISRCSPAGVVEIGAGTGYWAYLLHQRGIDVAAFDIEPAPSPHNQWFGGTPPWHPVDHGDHDVAGHYPDRTLMLVWPTKNEIWAATAVERYHDVGGACIVHVGEGPGGRTGDDVFHALLGELTTCAQCEYGSTTSPCICSVDARWRRTETIELPHWPGYDDDLRIYTRRTAGRASPRRQRWMKSGDARSQQR